MDSNNRTVPVASTRVARNASFVQLQNCLVTMLSYFSLRCQRQYAYLGVVVRNDTFAQLQKLSRYDGIVFLCGASASTPILGNICCVPYRYLFLSKIITWPLFTLEKLGRFTLNQPLTSVLCSSIQCVPKLCPNGFPYISDATDLYSASRWCKTILGSCFRKFCWVY